MLSPEKQSPLFWGGGFKNMFRQSGNGCLGFIKRLDSLFLQ
jgi:hypothetical protein